MRPVGASVRDPDGAEPPQDGVAHHGDDLLAVIAHSLLSSVSVIVGGTELLSAHWADLPSDDRASLLASMHTQARHIGDVLGDLMRLGDPLLIETLDGLTADDVTDPPAGDAT